MKHPVCTPSHQILVPEPKVGLGTLQKHKIRAFLKKKNPPESLSHQKKKKRISLIEILFP